MKKKKKGECAHWIAFHSFLKETLLLNVAFKNGGDGRRGPGERIWVNGEMPVSFLFTLISAPALYAWAYNWGKANTVLKQTCISQQMLCQPHRNMFPFPKLGPHCFPIACCFYYDLHEKYILQWKWWSGSRWWWPEKQNHDPVRS